MLVKQWDESWKVARCISGETGVVMEESDSARERDSERGTTQAGADCEHNVSSFLFSLILGILFSRLWWCVALVPDGEWNAIATGLR